MPPAMYDMGLANVHVKGGWTTASKLSGTWQLTSNCHSSIGPSGASGGPAHKLRLRQ